MKNIFFLQSGITHCLNNISFVRKQYDRHFSFGDIEESIYRKGSICQRRHFLFAEKFMHRFIRFRTPKYYFYFVLGNLLPLHHGMHFFHRLFAIAASCGIHTNDLFSLRKLIIFICIFQGSLIQFRIDFLLISVDKRI